MVLSLSGTVQGHLIAPVVTSGFAAGRTEMRPIMTNYQSDELSATGLS
jgi:hypothetical protein